MDLGNAKLNDVRIIAQDMNKNPEKELNGSLRKEEFNKMVKISL